MAARTRAVAGLQGSPRRFKSRPRCSLRTHQSTRPRDVFRWSAGGNTHPDGAVWFIALAAELSRLQAGHAAFERRTLFRAGNHCGAAGPQKLCQAPDDVVSPRAGCPLDCRFWLQSGRAETGDGPDQGKGRVLKSGYFISQVLGSLCDGTARLTATYRCDASEY